jgi:hypothetical protein
MSKLIGLGLSIVGVVGFALSYPQIRDSVNLSLPSGLDNILMIVGAALLLIGVYMAFNGSRKTKQSPEVPIYEGTGKNRKIVGFQRMQK